MKREEVESLKERLTDCIPDYFGEWPDMVYEKAPNPRVLDVTVVREAIALCNHYLAASASEPQMAVIEKMTSAMCDSSGNGWTKLKVSREYLNMAIADFVIQTKAGEETT